MAEVKTEKKQMRAPIETGAPDGFQYMHPTMRKNFGQWKWHDHPRPGVLRHAAKSGDEIWTSESWNSENFRCIHFTHTMRHW